MRLFLTILALLYAVSPYDLMPDWLVGFGWLDDISILGLLWWYIYRYNKSRFRGPGASTGRGGGYSQYQSQEQFAEDSGRLDAYQILGVDRKASQSEIRLAYDKLKIR